MELLITTIVAIPIGIGCSIFAWWILFRKITPKLTFGDKIHSGKEDRKGRFYIHFQNSGKRDIIDVLLHARIYLPNHSNWKKIIKLRLSHDHWPILKSKRKGKLRSTELLIDYSHKFDRNYPEEIRQKAKNKTLTINDLLGLGENVRLRITAFAYDKFSGARKYFESNYYNQNDIE